MERFYPIGTPGEPWGEEHKRQWLEARTVERSYAEEVGQKIAALDETFEVINYGALPIDSERYGLVAVKAATAGDAKPWALITGGVHGYETSGVQGALAFLAGPIDLYRDRMNFLVAPCVSPWGYEVINRWNPNCIDPNRSFVANSSSEEAAALMRLLEDLDLEFLVHLDLHETTDSDEEEFRPALAARDGQMSEPGLIPDGFYNCADSENPQPEFQAAIINRVSEVTHIAPADSDGQIIGSDVTHPGVIQYPYRKLGLCAGVTNARYTTTTEVYPDSPNATAEICNQAQVAAICGGLDYALANP